MWKYSTSAKMFKQEENPKSPLTLKRYSESGEENPTPPKEFSIPIRPYKVLVLGESGVGKTAFIDALYAIASRTPRTYSESVYIPTRKLYTKYIPAIDSIMLDKKSIIDNIRAKQFDEVVANFMLRQHGNCAEDKFKLLQEQDSWHSNIPDGCHYREIMISELPAETRTLPERFIDEFDKVVIMTDYHDITSMRSAQYWAELIHSPKRKTIVCVNKCEVAPLSKANDFRDRKSVILRHFAEQCHLEFISVSTEANLTFLYKHLDVDY